MPMTESRCRNVSKYWHNGLSLIQRKLTRVNVPLQLQYKTRKTGESQSGFRLTSVTTNGIKMSDNVTPYCITVIT